MNGEQLAEGFTESMKENKFTRKIIINLKKSGQSTPKIGVEKETHNHICKRTSTSSPQCRRRWSFYEHHT